MPCMLREADAQDGAQDDGRALDPTAAAIASAAAMVSVVTAAIVELLLHFPLSVWFYAASLTVFTIGAAVALHGLRWPWPLEAVQAAAWWFAAAMALLALHLVPWTSRKPFLAQLDRVRVGMTPAEVEAIMGDYRRGTGWRVGNDVLAPEDAMVFRHSDDARFNSDWGVVRFAEGRVVEVRFDPD
jgi:hypothetical protein